MKLNPSQQNNISFKHYYKVKPKIKPHAAVHEPAGL